MTVEEIVQEFNSLKSKIDELKLENAELKDKIDNLHMEHIKAWSDMMANITPVKVYHHKKRGNTTIKFANGHCVTVRRRKREKDSIDIAVAYALQKNMYSRRMIDTLVQETEEVGDAECKKD